MLTTYETSTCTICHKEIYKIHEVWKHYLSNEMRCDTYATPGANRGSMSVGKL